MQVEFDASGAVLPTYFFDTLKLLYYNSNDDRVRQVFEVRSSVTAHGHDALGSRPTHTHAHVCVCVWHRCFWPCACCGMWSSRSGRSAQSGLNSQTYVSGNVYSQTHACTHMLMSLFSVLHRPMATC